MQKIRNVAVILVCSAAGNVLALTSFQLVDNKRVSLPSMRREKSGQAQKQHPRRTFQNRSSAMTELKSRHLFTLTMKLPPTLDLGDTPAG